MTDVTEFSVRGARLYLSPVMDLYNGEIVTFEMLERPPCSLVGNMLKKAISKLRGPEQHRFFTPIRAGTIRWSRTAKNLAHTA